MRPERTNLHNDFEQFAGDLPHPVSYMDSDLLCRYVNKAWEAFVGIPIEEIKGRFLYEIVGKESHNVMEPNIHTVLGGKAVSFEAEITVAGAERAIEATFTPHIDPRGTVVGFFACIDDTAQRQENEKALQRSEGLYRAVVDTVVDGIITIDPTGTILTVNPAVEKIFGYVSDELTGNNVKMLMPEPYHSRHNHYLDNYMQTGEKKIIGYGREVSGRRKDGTVFPLELAISETMLGENRIFTGILRDISLRKQQEEELKNLNENLEKRVRRRTKTLVKYQKHLRSLTSELTLTEYRERKQLAAELHDYLAQLLVLCQMIVRKVQNGNVPETMDRSLQDLEKNIAQALRYTRTLIADLSPTILNEAGLLPALHWLAQHIHQEHGLQVQVTEDIRDLKLDEKKALLVFQAVRELLINIVKHAKVDRAEIHAALLPKNHLQIEVTDRGVGFTKADTRRTDPDTGKFGLFSVQERLRAIGCHFAIQSVSGEGTQAVIRVPVLPPEAASALPTAVVEPEGDFRVEPKSRKRNEIRILLVDDHKMVREGIRKILESYPSLTVVGEAADGLEAIAMTKEHRPDVVVMDLNMPRMNGIEATRNIKTLLPHTVVIGVTVHDDPGLKNAMLKAGAASFFTKAGPSEELYQTILRSV